MSDGSKSSAVPVVLGAGVAVAIGVGVVMFLPAPEPEPQPTLVTDVVVSTPAQVVDTTQTVTAAVPEAPAPTTPAGPLFDTFRVDTDGSMVIAGRAEPGQVVDIMLSGEAVERVTADASGSFVALPVAGPSDMPRRLSLVADPDGARLQSETSYVVAPIAAPVIIADTVAAPDEPAAADVAASIETLPEQREAPALPVIADAVAPPAVPDTPTVLQADSSGVRVVQNSPALGVPNVALDAITYDPEGDVQLAGRATGEGAVQIYIDNQPLTTSPVTTDGDWRVDLPDIDTGVYTLRIDEVDTEGEVVSRVETPFKREEAEDVAAVLAEETSADGFEVAVKTVQPGATLWAIAEETLGNGIFYVEVFEANTDLIRDPDLIYPGQIFRLPEITQ